MRRILLVLPFLLLFINSKALNISSVTPSSGTSFSTNPSNSTNIGLDFQISTNQILIGIDFKIQIIYFPLTGNPEIIADTGFGTFSSRVPAGYLWVSKINGTLAAGKSKGKIALRLIRKNAAGDMIEDSTTQFTLNDGTSVPNPGPGIPNTEFNKRFVIPGIPNRSSFRNNNGTVIVAKNGNYHMDFQADGNLVLYNGSQALWASGKKLGGNAKLIFDSRGMVETWNLENDSMYWTTHEKYVESRKIIWVLQDDGNFVGFSDYNIDANGNVHPWPDVFGETRTSGGKVSTSSGRLW